MAEDLGKGADAAGRGRDGDDLEGGRRSAKWLQSGPRLRPPFISAARIFQKSRRSSKREACVSRRTRSVSRIARATSGSARSAYWWHKSISWRLKRISSSYVAIQR